MMIQSTFIFFRGVETTNQMILGLYHQVEKPETDGIDPIIILIFRFPSKSPNNEPLFTTDYDYFHHSVLAIT